MKGMLLNAIVNLYERDVATCDCKDCMKWMLQHETVKMYARDVATWNCKDV